MTRLVFILILLAITVSYIALIKSETYFFPYPDTDTVYADGFSYAKFSQIEVSMSHQQVRQLLGPPFLPFHLDDARECWPYSRDGKLWPVADFAWVAVGVCFEGGKVTSTYRTVFSN